MHLKSLQLTHFKNYATLGLTFSKKLNLITGPNGTGKTNLLDAVHFLCNTKSAFLSSDPLAIQQGQSFFRIEGHFAENGKNVKVECVCQLQEGKTLLLDGKAPDRLSNYIGRFPVVLVSPYDTDLIREGSEIRRKFFDQVLSQYNSEYLEKWMAYNKLLKQRNALLKQFAEQKRSNLSLLSVYDEQLLPLNLYIYLERKKFVEAFLPLVVKAYKQLAADAENIQIEYISDCKEEFAINFKKAQANDLAAQRTTLGIHTDDYEFTFNQSPMKKFGSQGQQKTFVLSLKLAHFDFLHTTKHNKPLLLLDDIFDRLDETRVANLANMVETETFGQVFVTDATPKRILSLFGGKNEEMAIFKTQQ